MAQPRDTDESDYESRLRAQYERLNPEPSWAQQARKTYHKQHDTEAEKGDEGEGHQDKQLSSGTIAIERLRDVNISAQNTTSVNVVAFHPSQRVPVLCVGTADRRVRLYNVNTPSPRPSFIS
jgi:U3 small nucleolar RNA-associated protein 18